MIEYIFAEIFKFNKSKLKYSTLVLYIPNIIVFLMYLINPKYYLVNWNEYLNLIITFLNYFVCPLAFGIIASYTFGSDYEDKTINVLFTYPIKRVYLLISKLVFILIIITITLISIFFLSLISGLALKHEVFTSKIFIYYFIAFIKMSIFHFMLIFIICGIAIKTKNILPGIIFIIAATLSNLLLVNTKLSSFYPWSAPLLLSPHDNIGRSYIFYTGSIFSLIIIFLIGLAICIKNYRYTE